jgi:hypothetical protein
MLLSNTRILADQVSCDCEDMGNVPGLPNLMRQPIPLLPDYAQELDDLFHNSETMVRTLLKRYWGASKG